MSALAAQAGPRGRNILFRLLADSPGEVDAKHAVEGGPTISPHIQEVRCGAWSAFLRQQPPVLLVGANIRGDTSSEPQDSGYLLSQFLCSARRPTVDAMRGGSLDNRVRLPLAVLQRVRERIIPDVPILWKTNLRDGFRGGLSWKNR
jgi:hypothetical protein